MEGARSGRHMAGGASSLAAALAAVAFAALAGACAVPVPFAEDLLFTTERDQLPAAEDCSRCHLEVFREWVDSPHASAWTSGAFERITAGYAAGDCLECHAPSPLGTAGEIVLRPDHRAEGVTCVTCHLSPDPDAEPLTMRGPHARTSPIDVHPVVTDPLFTRAELCGTCHEGILRQWRESPDPAEGDKPICQECHMPAVRRRIESYHPEHRYSALVVALARPVAGRHHSFGLPDDPWEDLDVEVERPAGGAPVRVHVTNRLPHAVPTGDYGRREARVVVEWAGGREEHSLRADLDEGIPAGASRTFEFLEAPREGALHVRLERRDPGSGAFELLAPAPPVPTSGEMGD